MGSDSTLLRAGGLACVRGERTLFSGVSFDLAGGSLLQVRGANGSGKTSLLRILCGLLSPEAGGVSWNGSEIRGLGEDYRAALAYVGHLNAVKDELDPAENLRYAAQVAGLSATAGEVDAALHLFGLGGTRLPCRLLSQGQKRRAALARLALSSSRSLWILDEPFAALDTGAVTITRSLIDGRVGRGGAVIFTTHQDVGFAGRDVQCIELTA